ncbi:helix-turn-helix domain-containing protein [Streptomyces sp. 2A115]|uniref:helix-turn-helix domain-containing protein n=1 Tax=Streptomyces sp. 2A115 TaxID=3457439 RepID=UPI003FD02AF1
MAFHSVRHGEHGHVRPGGEVRLIRRRRLEQARLELAASVGPPSISELAAHWQFADSSHFIRSFKKQYGQTPVQFARSRSRPTPGRTST